MRNDWQLDAATHLAQALRIYGEHGDELAETFTGATPLSMARAMLTALGKPATSLQEVS